ncbi:MAG: DegT/DnrJ/EryC1/StrS family aminotransferase [Flavobacteriales bacterium]
MANSKIWLSSPHMGDNEIAYVNEAFDTNWIAPVGPHLNRFEERLSDISNGYSVAALSSGTAAIHLALVLLGVSDGDEVLCSSFTFSASANPIVYQRAKPIFIDSEYDTWNMCPNKLEEAIQSRLKAGVKPKAIIVVHLYGMPAKMNEIKAVASKFEIPVVEDAAEGLGSAYFEEPLGTLSEIGIFSFNGNKIITTSSGGALISSNDEYVQKAKFLSTQARDDAPHYEHSNIGFNYRLSNVCAAIGLGQLEVLDKRVEQRRNNHSFYEKALSQSDKIQFLKEPDGFYSNRWLTTILLPDFELREKIRLALAEENIESRPLWKPMHLQPIFKDCLIFGGNVCEELFERGLCLPSGSNLDESDLTRITDKILDHVKG